MSHSQMHSMQLECGIRAHNVLSRCVHVCAIGQTGKYRRENSTAEYIEEEEEGRKPINRNNFVDWKLEVKKPQAGETNAERLPICV